MQVAATGLVAATTVGCCEGDDAAGLREKCSMGCRKVWGSLEVEVRCEADLQGGDMM